MAALGALLALQGCREDQPNQPLTYQPGVYQGQPDQPLSEQQVEALRQRAARQQM
ncbi:MAG: hypothetical protein ACREH6_06075 [Geminicoccaceae bacterium]